ncbi:putative F-box domain, leucine-rich repeat domain superfamily, F-box-like domain superfamily [Arabidopsis thaliana]|uniref:F-box domain n=1 Tax=Arabidopsis thaliana x Arabidopsis arenosa TaxID=1240361 RepID=A0A8T2GYG5_9BRAS|nr:F-box domain [Arabidopsis thaliana x Arabidopsis arenosa]
MSLLQNASSISSNKRISIDAIDNVNQLPDDMLSKILSELSTEEAIKTCVLSKQWGDTWKQVSNLCFDMRKTITINGIVLPQLLDRAANQITEVINKHNGHLQTCIISHYSYQLEDGMLASWIQSLTSMKHTKNLILANFNGRFAPTGEDNVLKLSTETFNHPSLRTLSLYQYILQDAQAFNNCKNLKYLDLFQIFAEVDVFNKVISSCPSLEVLILQIIFFNPSGHLKIDHKTLRILSMSCNQIDSIEVRAARLDILSIEYIPCESDNVVLEIPRLQFGRNYWVAGRLLPHTSINISCPPQKQESNGMVKWDTNYATSPASLSVSLDLKNPREVEVLRKILAVWTEKMIELEISFKNNNPLGEEGNSSDGGAQNNLWEKAEPFSQC